MTTTVLEQSDILVGAPLDSTSTWLRPEQAERLVGLSERMGVRVVSWKGRNRIRVHQFVGVVRVGDLQLEILPKLEGCADAGAIRRNLLEMISLTEDLELQPSEWVHFIELDRPLVSALARLYCRRLLEVVRRGLPQDYVVHHEILPRLRGKIEWPSQVKLHLALRTEFSCVFDERSDDTALNRTLKAALELAAPALEWTGDSRTVAELRSRMADVEIRRPLGEELARLRTDRMTRHLRPLLTLAKLLLGSRNPDLGRSSVGAPDMYALVWDMNVLFEEYVGRLTRRVLRPEGFEVGIQEHAAYLARDLERARPAFLLRPDVLISEGRVPRVVMDTKWKRLASSEANLGVASADVYQMVAYCERYGAPLAALVYPHSSAAGSPGVLKEFEIQSQRAMKHRVRIVTVDLANLASVPGQLERGLM